MGQQQLIIIALLAIIVGLSVFGGLQWTKSQNQAHERDIIIQRFNILVGEAKKYAARPAALGGGDGSFLGFTPPTKLAFFSGIKVYTTAGDDWVLFQGFGSMNGSDEKTPILVIGQYDKNTQKWTTLSEVN